MEMIRTSSKLQPLSGASPMYFLQRFDAWVASLGVPLCEGRVNIAQVHQVQRDKEERVTRRYKALRGGVKIAVYGCWGSCGAGSMIHLCSGGDMVMRS